MPSTASTAFSTSIRTMQSGEGVGSYYDNQFGRSVGKAAIRQHFEGFWGMKRDPALLLNVHYLTSEQIHVRGDEADGQWVHCQPWIFSDGSSLLRSSRLNQPISQGRRRLGSHRGHVPRMSSSRR